MNKQVKLQLILEEIKDLSKIIKEIPLDYQLSYVDRMKDLLDEFLKEAKKDE